MKTINTLTLTSVNSVLLFLASFGISYALVSEIFFGNPKREFLGIMICLLVAGIASKMRKQAEK
jgi:hypothetical protein